MSRYWLEPTARISQPKAVALLIGMWPADLLAQLLDEQALPLVSRLHLGGAPPRTDNSKVVSLRAHRTSRQHS